MNNKKLGIIFLIISLVLVVILLQMIKTLNTEAKSIGCFDNKDCIGIESNLSIVHVAFGFIGFVFALGFYLIFFAKGEEAILKRLEENKREILSDEKFNLILRGLDAYEQRVIKAVKEQDGITQSTLQIRTDMSKAKLSYVLNDLEKKGLVKRVKKGRTFAVFLKGNF